MFRVVFLFLLISLMKNTAAQVNVVDFSAIRYSDYVTLTWIIGPGNTCSDLEVQHGTDSSNYTTVYTYPGICGNSSSNEQYSWQHENMVCGLTNYYRLFSRNAGILATTKIQPSCLGALDYKVWSVQTDASISFMVELNLLKSQNWTLEIYDSSGRLLLNSQLTSSSNRIDLRGNASGVLCYVLRTEEGTLYRDKILLLK